MKLLESAAVVGDDNQIVCRGPVDRSNDQVRIDKASVLRGIVTARSVPLLIDGYGAISQHSSRYGSVIFTRGIPGSRRSS
jgi:hypothetical protein